MPFTGSDNGDESTLFLSGHLDEHSVAEFKALTDALVAEGRRHVVLDMSGLENIESVRWPPSPRFTALPRGRGT
ncbi:hypothetical protein SAMN02745121_05649 [Nannocystis exedens]|uniref:STAS domain-containing protein n=1 Tax=Nannocystis exedens TaxID=54 RepID=A0A1I2DP04_9BACT|nr:STAS domain-containing protein [Nannocystis exedens]PCC69018.1 hypothetical protein NAEX_02040 [Nannocystis exedens]SFE82207.1 hypothetical protein SAMN02745121_05649 [Nannocystis exedens]